MKLRTNEGGGEILMGKLNGSLAAMRRFGMPVAAALALLAVAGCSLPSVFGSDDSPLPLPPPLEAGDDGVVADSTGRSEEDAQAAADADDAATDAAPEDAPASDGEYPELADVPEGAAATRAAEKSPEAEASREALASGLVADRDSAKHTDEELRGGRVAAVAPPRPAPPAPPRSEIDETPAGELAGEPAPSVPAPSAPKAAAPPAPDLTPASRPAAAVPLAPQTPQITPQARALPPRPAAPPVQTATAYSSSTFEPSRAQPLPADLAASLPAGVAQRYQETLRQPVAGAPAGLPVAPRIGGRGAGAYISIPFASGSSQLSGNDRRIIAEAANAARGGFSRIRVVGHASSTASTQSESERLVANWQISQARATAVADELIRQGIDAARIVIEAVGDSQAAYAGGTMDAEAAARRVDLFLE